MYIEFKRLPEVDKADIVELMNHALVRQQMPLLGESFDDADYEEFMAAKERLWEEHGYGPWAIVVDGQFAGWGGLQPEGNDTDLGLVLHPRFWGTGGMLYEKIIKRAFGEMGFESVIILLPASRTRVRGLLRLGFEGEGEIELEGERFIRYRLQAPG